MRPEPGTCDAWSWVPILGLGRMPWVAVGILAGLGGRRMNGELNMGHLLHAVQHAM